MLLDAPRLQTEGMESYCCGLACCRACSEHSVIATVVLITPALSHQAPRGLEQQQQVVAPSPALAHPGAPLGRTHNPVWVLHPQTTAQQPLSTPAPSLRPTALPACWPVSSGSFPRGQETAHHGPLDKFFLHPEISISPTAG